MIKNISAVAKHLEQAVQDFTDYAIVGVSGGVDSSVVAAICVAALGTERTVLVSMPYDKIDTQTFNARSAELADQLSAIHHVVSIGKATDALQLELETVLKTKPLAKLTYANIRPRLRMNVLYAISGEIGYTKNKRARVMGTGHLSEDLVGYDTKGGDALADIFVLSDLLKSEVYQLAAHYKIPKSIVEAEPSAGLYPGQTDKDELGYSYAELEPATLALFQVISRGVSVSQINPELPEFKGQNPEYVNFVIARYKVHFHKHQAPVTVSVRRPEWFAASDSSH